MALPFFYIAAYNNESHLILQEETSKHIVQVLRMGVGEQLNLTDGKGNLLTCEITDAHKKHCGVLITKVVYQEKTKAKVSIAISLLKNADRFEWFLEKATEIGVSEITPLLCERTEKEKFRYDRMLGICVSAMLQSQQCWLPLLHEPLAYKKVIEQAIADVKLIAHCEEVIKQNIYQSINKSVSQLIFIGPEGDFTSTEIELAVQHDFIPVSLGVTRLRTETAGVVATTILSL